MTRTGGVFDFAIASCVVWFEVFCFLLSCVRCDQIHANTDDDKLQRQRYRRLFLALVSLAVCMCAYISPNVRTYLCARSNQSMHACTRCAFDPSNGIVVGYFWWSRSGWVFLLVRCFIPIRLSVCSDIHGIAAAGALPIRACVHAVHNVRVCLCMSVCASVLLSEKGLRP